MIFDHPGGDISPIKERAIVHSALWAAAGDALGWITELARDSKSVSYRSGSEKVTKTVDWQRTVGGRQGPRVFLPAGTYSDDTQLRLAVSRSIRGDGHFDAETFAKIELPVWPTYALGGGLGTKAAALNLSKRGVNWFSNFYANGDQKYVSGGGNGAAMRIQPHVWSNLTNPSQMRLDVLKDSLITHGHPHGFCGAMFHAILLSECFSTGKIAAPSAWYQFVGEFRDIPQLIESDRALSTFWRAAWEAATHRSLEDALKDTVSQANDDLDRIFGILSSSNSQDGKYKAILESLGCLTAKFRGSGFKTALAAAALAHLFQSDSPENAIILAANVLESDTDTIATMAGAILGAISDSPPPWRLQDTQYIVNEAQRLFRLNYSKEEETFIYPDLGRWNPPTKQTAAVGAVDGGIALAGLGRMKPIGDPYIAGDATWQWSELSFGQTILAKRKSNLNDSLPAEQMPARPRVLPRYIPVINTKEKASTIQEELPLVSEQPESKTNIGRANRALRISSIDDLTDEAIKSGFNDAILGKTFNQCIEMHGTIESAVAFASIISKAKLARQKRNS